MELISPELKKLLIFQQGIFRAQPNKKTHSENFLIFREMELYSTKFKILLNFFQKKFFFYFRRVLSKPGKQKEISLKKYLIFF